MPPLVLDGSAGISGVDGTASNPAIEGTDSNTGIFYPAADTVAIATGGSQRAVVDASGRVGIGETSPAVTLHLKAAVCNVRLEDADTSAYANVGVDNSGSMYLQADPSNSQASTAIYFATDGTERARITSGGNLWVNATGAVINSNEAIGAIALNSTSPAISGKNSAGATSACVEVWNNATSGNNLFIMFSTETAYTTRGNIDYNRGAGQVRYNATSDATLKNIIGDSDGQRSLQILSTTRIREYAWKDDEQQKPQIGVIAQELYETYKGAVSVGGDIEKTDKEGNVTTEYRPWGVDKTAFTFHLIAGWQAHEKMIKEQQAMIDELKAKVAALENA